MLRLDILLTGIDEEEALRLIAGAPSERIMSVARKALLKAREDAKLSGRVTFTELKDGSYEVRDGVEIVGIARHYKRYWQIYIRKQQVNLRRVAWPDLRQAIVEAICSHG